MHIDWTSLLIVFIVTFGAATAVVTLVSVGLVGLSARAAIPEGPPAVVGANTGTIIGGLCLLAASAIVLYGLYLIVT
jgi:hypothetical protein